MVAYYEAVINNYDIFSLTGKSTSFYNIGVWYCQ